MDLVLHWIKLIRIADKSVRMETVNQYEVDKLASDSEDDKCIYLSERRAVKKENDKRKKLPGTDRRQSVFSPLPIPMYISDRALALCSLLGPCYECGQFGHLQVKCTQVSFQVGC